MGSLKDEAHGTWIYQIKALEHLKVLQAENTPERALLQMLVNNPIVLLLPGSMMSYEETSEHDFTNRMALLCKWELQNLNWGVDIPIFWEGSLRNIPLSLGLNWSVASTKMDKDWTRMITWISLSKRIVWNDQYACTSKHVGKAC